MNFHFLFVCDSELYSRNIFKTIPDSHITLDK